MVGQEADLVEQEPELVGREAAVVLDTVVVVDTVVVEGVGRLELPEVCY